MLKDAFTALFHACPILFVGYGFSDDDLEAMLDRVRALAGRQPPEHFALVPAEEVTPYQKRKLDRAGIRLIRYPNPDGRHAEVVAILRELAASVASRAAVAPAPARPRGRAKVLAALKEIGVAEWAAGERRQGSRPISRPSTSPPTPIAPPPSPRSAPA